ncbi:MAG: hypothetical protein EXS25_11855 [Pedosphaera sp.]|nr:hypothetical protein [Pedosphaera sp.]
MNVFLAALNSVAPHFRVRGHTLRLSRGHPLERVEINLRGVAAHKTPGPATAESPPFSRTLGELYDAGLSFVGSVSFACFTHTMGETESSAT